MESKFFDQDVDVVSLADKGIVIGCFVNHSSQETSSGTLYLKNGKSRNTFFVLGHEGPYIVKEHSDSKTSTLGERGKRGKVSKR